MNNSNTHLSILRRKQVESRTGLCRSTIYAKIKSGDFPPPIPLGARAVGWVEKEIDDWLYEKFSQRQHALTQ
jgi:prophage regulatory protein